MHSYLSTLEVNGLEFIYVGRFKLDGLLKQKV
jgi:hypothetical protein